MAGDDPARRGGFTGGRIVSIVLGSLLALGTMALGGIQPEDVDIGEGLGLDRPISGSPSSNYPKA